MSQVHKAKSIKKLFMKILPNFNNPQKIQHHENFS